MPTMANITVKKADGTTDVVYTAVAGSSGDKTPAIWKNVTVGTTKAEQPTLELLSIGNASGTARRMRYKYTWPTVSQDAGGNKVISGKNLLEGSFVVVQNQTAVEAKEAVYQGLNLLGSLLVKQSTDEGYAPRG